MAIRVFVVDHQGIVRDGLRLAVQHREGLELVGEASDGEEAVHKILELLPDVALTDTVLPGIDGYEVIRRTRAQGFNGRFLILTAREDPDAAFEASVLGAHGFLRKTVGLEEVIDAIEAVAGGLQVFRKEDEVAAIALLGRMARRTRQISEVAATLTKRERDVLPLMAQGLSNRKIASMLAISERTVETHISSLYRKLGVTTRVLAVGRAVALGLLSTPGQDRPVQNPAPTVGQGRR